MSMLPLLLLEGEGVVAAVWRCCQAWATGTLRPWTMPPTVQAGMTGKEGGGWGTPPLLRCFVADADLCCCCC